MQSVAADAMQLRLLGDFELRVAGRPVALPTQAQRVLGCLGVVAPSQQREALAGRLWGDSPQDRAQRNLRNALWRMRQVSTRLIAASRDVVQLRDDVEVDLAESRLCAREIIDHGIDPAAPLPLRLLERDLLPTWDEDWIVLERERARQLRIHALEAMSRSLARHGRYADAVETAFAAVIADPLRESANAALIAAHVAEGNRAAAMGQLGTYRALLGDELGLAPSASVEALVTAGADPAVR